MQIPTSAIVLFATSLATSSMWCTSLMGGADSHASPESSGHAAADDSAAPHGSAEGHAEASAHAEGSAHGEGSRRFPVPFAWEASSADPIATTRAFMRDITTDNATFTGAHPADFFKPFLNAQHPRATIIACSDSRVQSPAIDATPEDDLFFIRNIGNQIVNSQGSIEYGVHHLKTPVLLIVGHTGCGAVRAAMGDYSKESPAIRHELEPLALPKELQKPDDNKAWAEAVVANVNQQVARSVALFAHEMEGGDLTVVGAVYDFRNDLKQGSGKLVVVNVNGQTAPDRVGGFVRAIASSSPGPVSSAGAPDGFQRSRHVFVSR